MRLGEFAKAERRAQVAEPAAEKCSEHDERAGEGNGQKQLPVSGGRKPMRARRRSFTAAEQDGQTNQCERDRKQNDASPRERLFTRRLHET